MFERLLGTSDRSLLVPATRVLLPAGLIVAGAIAVAMLAPDAGTKQLFDNVHWTVSFAAAAMLAWIGARRAQGADAAPARWLAWALTAYAGGQVLWDIQVWTGWNPFPGPSDLLYLCLGPLSAIGLLGFLRRGLSPAHRRLAMLDAAGLSVAVLALALALYLPKRGSIALLPMTVLIAYPVMLCGAGCVGIVCALALHLAPRRGAILFLSALVLQGVLWMQWNVLTLDDALQEGTVFNALFSLTVLAQGVGAMLWRSEISDSPRWARWCETMLRLLPLIIVTVSSLAVVLAYTLPGVPPVVRGSALIGSVVVVGLASLRQSLLISENYSLIETERTLRRTNEMYRVLVEQAAEGIFISDQEGRYVDVNPSGAAMLRMTREEILGMHVGDIVAPEQVDRLPGEIGNVRAGVSYNRDWRLVRKDGTQFSAEVSAKILPDGRLLGMVRDISERQALEAQLRQAQKMEAVGTLAAGIAHDFNNLIMAIQGNAELASRETGSDHPAHPSLAEIRTASTRATQLVRQIVAFSRPHAPVVETVRLSRVVLEVVGLLRSGLPAGIEILTSFDDHAPAVSADSAQIHQVLVNLVTNAWQAMEGRAGTISLRLEHRVIPTANTLGLPAGSFACLSVTDTGRGMDPATRERIFEPFFTTNHRGGGTGLGLAIVHNIVRGHHGGLFVESSPGAGTTIGVMLPAALDEPSDPESSSAPASFVGGRGCRVVYVDDEASLVSLVVRQLTQQGYEARGFTSPELAIAELTRDPLGFDVLISDFNMPTMTGVDLIAAVRQLRPDSPFILTSGLVTRELLAEAERTGIRKLLNKPQTVEELCQAIELIVGDRLPVSRETPPVPDV